MSKDNADVRNVSGTVFYYTPPKGGSSSVGTKVQVLPDAIVSRYTDPYLAAALEEHNERLAGTSESKPSRSDYEWRPVTGVNDTEVKCTCGMLVADVPFIRHSDWCDIK